MDEEYERILLIKPDVFIYKIPPRTTNRAYRASDWKLDEPDWVGKLKLVSKGNDCILKLEDKNTGQLFAKCPVDAYPGIAIEAVSDSSRYFVIRIQDDDHKRSAFIGIGFADRGDSFDLNVALQDHFKSINTSDSNEPEAEETQPKLDLKLKEGQTIKVNLNLSKKPGSASRPRAKASCTGTGILPPPPGGIKLPPVTAKMSNISTTNIETTKEAVGKSNDQEVKSNTATDLLLDFDGLSISRSNEAKAKKSNSNELWHDFEGAANLVGAQQSKQESDWTAF